MNQSNWIKWIMSTVLLVTGVCASIVLIGGLSQAAAAMPPPPNRVAGVNAAGDYIVLS
jgi:multisubunit Na+/H+ antiporter MnhC subunit